jgi:hypothetical protein
MIRIQVIIGVPAISAVGVMAFPDEPGRTSRSSATNRGGEGMSAAGLHERSGDKQR